MTIITNENIKQLVRLYIEKKELPDLPKKIGDWDTSRVTDMKGLFEGYNDFNEPLHWDTSKVTDMSYMFAKCKEFNQPLTWETSNVTNMIYMFAYCESLDKPLKFKTHNVTNMKSMFFDCIQFNQPLTLNTIKVTDMKSMFEYCESFDKPLSLNTPNVTNMNSMFKGCKKFNQPLTLNTIKVTDMSYMFFDCESFDKQLSLNARNVTNMSCMFKGCTNFNQPLKFKTRNVTNMSCMFKGCKIFNKPLNFKTINVTDMSDMFADCESFDQPLEWDTSSVTDMSTMFSSCKRFNQPLEWDTSSVTNMSDMFAYCEDFDQPLDWDTSSVEYMGHMFLKCTRFNQSLEWDTSSAEDMSGMFLKCERFNQPLNWATHNVKNMAYMFDGCVQLNSLIRLNTIEVEDMSQMFKDCRSFNQPLDFNTSNVEDMSEMFMDCDAFDAPLVSREVVYTDPVNHVVTNFQSWKFDHLMDMTRMFENCRSFNRDLTSWVIDPNIIIMDRMFMMCNIQQNFKPTIRITTAPVAPRANFINPFEVHQFSNKVDIKKLILFLEKKTTTFPEDLSFPAYIEDTITTWINLIENHTIEREKKHLDEIERIEQIEKIEIPTTVSNEMSDLYTLRKKYLDDIHFKGAVDELKIERFIKKLEVLLVTIKPDRKEKLEREKDLLQKLLEVERKIDKTILRTMEKKDEIVALQTKKKMLMFDVKKSRDKIPYYREGLNRLMTNILKKLHYRKEETWFRCIFHSLEYVKKQPVSFIASYVECFITDNLKAYKNDQLSCAKGVVERFTLCLATACGTLLTTQNKDFPITEYEYIKDIIENSLNKAIPDNIYRWYRIHSDPKHKFTHETKEQRRNNLKEFLLQKFPEEEVKIDELIVEQANAVGYDDDDFMHKANENTIIDFKNLNNIYKNSPKTRRLKPRPRPRVRKANTHSDQPQESIRRLTRSTIKPRTRNTNKNKSRNVPVNVQPKPTLFARLPRSLRPRVRKTNTPPMGTSLNGPLKPSIFSRLTKSTIKPRTRKILGTSLNGPHV
jgi:hypothetical protein